MLLQSQLQVAKVEQWHKAKRKLELPNAEDEKLGCTKSQQSQKASLRKKKHLLKR